MHTIHIADHHPLEQSEIQDQMSLAGSTLAMSLIWISNSD
jgi:hypothetical protein